MGKLYYSQIKSAHFKLIEGLKILWQIWQELKLGFTNNWGTKIAINSLINAQEHFLINTDEEIEEQVYMKAKKSKKKQRLHH